MWQTKARFTSIEWPGISYFDRDLKGPIRFPHYAFEFANPGISKPDYETFRVALDSLEKRQFCNFVHFLDSLLLGIVHFKNGKFLQESYRL